MLSIMNSICNDMWIISHNYTLSNPHTKLENFRNNLINAQREIHITLSKNAWGIPSEDDQTQTDT